MIFETVHNISIKARFNKMTGSHLVCITFSELKMVTLAALRRTSDYMWLFKGSKNTSIEYALIQAEQQMRLFMTLQIRCRYVTNRFRNMLLVKRDQVTPDLKHVPPISVSLRQTDGSFRIDFFTSMQ